jgi:polysaccharide chain length determinant protein (PEP-CTERM system associated)
MLPGKTYGPDEIIHIVKSRGWIVGVAILGCTYLALVVSALLPNVYSAETLIQVVPQRVPNDIVRSTVTMRTEDRLEALSAQVMSRTELERLIKDFDLYPRERTRYPMQDVVDRMRVNISKELVRAQSDRPVDSFYLRFKYSDATTAAKVTERLSRLFIDQNSRDREVITIQTDNFLSSSLEQARKRLEEQEQKLAVFRERNAGRLPTQLDFNMQAIQNAQLQLQQLTESLARDRDRRLTTEQLLKEAQAEQVVSAPVPVPANTDPASAIAAGATAKRQLELARAELAKLELSRTPEHPDIARAKRMIGDLEKKAAAEAASIKSGETPSVAFVSPQDQLIRERIRQMRAEVESLDRQIQFKEAQENSLRGRVGEYQRRIESIPGIESEWVSLSRDYETQQTAYKQLLAKSEESKVAVKLEGAQIGEQFRVLDPARIPERPISPIRLQINAIGAGVGLVLGLLILGLLEFLDSSFRSETDFTGVMNVPVLAQVPLVVTQSDLTKQRHRRLIYSTVAVALCVAAGIGAWTLHLWRYIV